MRSMPRLAASTVTAALALAVLGMPGVALAGGPDVAAEVRSEQAPTAPPSAAAPARPAPVAVAPAAAAPELPFVGPRVQGVVADPPAAAVAARPEAARPATAARAVKPARAATPQRTAEPAKAPRTPETDPRGNNGTFKVDGPVLDTSHGNEPHVDCAFRLIFFGYDAGQLGRISLTAIAPTPGATTRVDGLPLISTSTAKGGQYDGSYPAAGTLTAGALGLDPTVAHHVKASVESVNADGTEVPGGAKSKVFWLEPCAPAAVAGAPVTAAEVAPAPVAAPAGSAFGSRSVVAAAPAPAAPAGTGVLAGGVSAQAVAPATVVAAPALLLPQGVGSVTARPATLPFTGSPQVLILLMAGLVTLAGGTALLVAVRRAG